METEVVKKGIDGKDLKFSQKCKVCDCEFKYCLDAVQVTRYGQNPREVYVRCPSCTTSCPVDVGQYTPIVLVYTPESDF